MARPASRLLRTESAFVLRGAEVAAETAETAGENLQLREQHRAAITERLGRVAGSGRKVLELPFDRQIITVNDVRNLTGTTYATANVLVSRMVDLAILEEMTT